MTVLFVLWFLSFPFFIFLMSKVLGFDFITVGIPQLAIASMFAFSYLGTLPLFFGWDEFRLDLVMPGDVDILKVMLLSSLSIFMVLFGVAFAKSIANRNLSYYRMQPLALRNSEFWFLFASIFIVLAVLHAYSGKISGFAINTLFQSGVEEAYLQRSEMGNNFDGKYHWYHLVLHKFSNIITFSLFVFYLKSKRKIYKYVFWFSFFISSFTAIMAIEKAPFVWLMVGLFFCYILTRKNGVLPLRLIVFWVVFVFIIMTVIYVYMAGFNSIPDALSAVISRAFAGSIEPAYHYLKFFPEHQDFLYGRTFPNPAGIFPYEPYNYTVEVNDWIHPDLQDLGIVGSMPTVFWGEAYVNFGLLGVFFISFFVGILLQLVEYLFSFLAKTPIVIGVYVWLLLHYKDLSIAGFSGYFVDFYLIFVLIFFGLLLLLTNRFRLKLRVLHAN